MPRNLKFQCALLVVATTISVVSSASDDLWLSVRSCEEADLAAEFSKNFPSGNTMNCRAYCFSENRKNPQRIKCFVRNDMQLKDGPDEKSYQQIQTLLEGLDQREEDKARAEITKSGGLQEAAVNLMTFRSTVCMRAEGALKKAQEDYKSLDSLLVCKAKPAAKK